MSLSQTTAGNAGRNWFLSFFSLFNSEYVADYLCLRMRAWYSLSNFLNNLMLKTKSLKVFHLLNWTYEAAKNRVRVRITLTESTWKYLRFLPLELFLEILKAFIWYSLYLIVHYIYRISRLYKIQLHCKHLHFLGNIWSSKLLLIRSLVAYLICN